MLRHAPLLALCALGPIACSVDPHRSPVCGMALLVGPRLILEQISTAHSLLSEPPRGLPAMLPARIVGGSDSTFVRVSSERDRVMLDYQGGKLPVVTVDSATRRDSTVFGVLLVDDSTATAEGVLIFDRPRPPAEYPQIGRLSDGERSVPFYGARLN
ncbi:MAG TPA: hypothetical protein VNG35_10105, partial [Gemmatimonadales bacterium]|nr:hypothetical protein [Gemmatimonadales bacterium]